MIKYNQLERKEKMKMLLNEFQQKINGIKKGTFVKAMWQSVKVVNGVKCVKVSEGVVRFVDYENMATTKAKRQNGMVARTTNNGGKTLIKDILYQASNGNLLVSMKTTTIKSKVLSYEMNGLMVDKATYETMVKPSSHNDSGIFTIKLENLLKLGK